MRRRGRHFRGAARLRSNAGSGRVAGARRGRRQPLARTEPASHRVIRSQAGHGAYRAGCRGGGADQPATGKKLSALLDDVVKRARDTKGVEVRTGNYNVWPNTGSKGKIAGWRGQGEVILESGISRPPPRWRRSCRTRPRSPASVFVVALRARPRSASCSRKRRKPSPGAGRRQRFWIFGLPSKLELGGSGGPGPMPRMMAMARTPAARAYSADVPLESGEVTVSVAVNGTIVLQ